MRHYLDRYQPQPFDTNGEVVSNEITELADVLAEHAHDSWVRTRLDQVRRDQFVSMMLRSLTTPFSSCVRATIMAQSAPTTPNRLMVYATRY